MSLKEQFAQYDYLNKKTDPESNIEGKRQKLWRAHQITEIASSQAGFPNVEQYRKACDIGDKLHLIKKPFFFISALDDTFFGPGTIPIDQCGENILLGVTRYGGHITYIEGESYMPYKQWWRKPTMEFLNYFVKKVAQEKLSEKHEKH